MTKEDLITWLKRVNNIENPFEVGADKTLITICSECKQVTQKILSNLSDDEISIYKGYLFKLRSIIRVRQLEGTVEHFETNDLESLDQFFIEEIKKRKKLNSVEETN